MADEPSLSEWAQHRVEAGLLKPLAAVERDASRFSRSRPPPGQRRLHVTQNTATRDKSGHSFVPFTIDVRFGRGEWREADIVGCVYVGSGDLYVKRGDDYRPASFLLGKDAEPAPGVCEADPGSKS